MLLIHVTLEEISDGGNSSFKKLGRTVLFLEVDFF